MSCDLQAPETCSHRTPKARKDHKCCECRGVIPKGEKYHYLAGVWDGEFTTYKTCADCQCLRCDLDKAMGDDDPTCGVALAGIHFELMEWGDREDETWQKLMGQFKAIQKDRGGA